MSRSIPELLAPAGGTQALVAAVQSGADAVYLGAGGFNARAGADNFGGGLAQAVAYSHQRGVKVYVTLNTVVREDELDALEDTVVEICTSGADGVIVQDLGVARLVHEMAPTLALHASTQMAVHSPQGVDFLARRGFRRVVLAREMRYEEIRACAGLGAELEVFVHGALCVACSGQCLLSSMIGGRSGNRGRCAQPCRMVYSAGDAQGYLLSTRDLCSLDRFDELLGCGAASLKIEGRLKRPEYVALTTSVYRAALDAWRDGRPFDAATAKDELRQMFNRGGFTEGYGPGVRDAQLMFAARPNHIGLDIGMSRRNGEVLLEKPVVPADALVLRRGDTDIPVRAAAPSEDRLSLKEARRGDRLVRLTSEEQLAALRRACEGEHRRFPLTGTLELRVGRPARLELTDGLFTAHAEGPVVERAAARPADPVRILAQLRKTGDTPFDIEDIRLDIDADAFVPVSALNALRREAVAMLLKDRAGAPVPCRRVAPPAAAPLPVGKTELLVQSGAPGQLARALRAGADRVAFAPDDLRPQALNEALAALPERFDLVLPPVMAGETLDAIHTWALDRRGRIDRVYISNISQLGLDWPFERVADFMLNVANSFALGFLAETGIARFTPSIELNRAQIKPLTGVRELIVYGRLPLMYLRHCPLRATRGLPGAHDACRRCDNAARGDCLNDLSLTDRTGALFPLRRLAADTGCVIRLMNSAKLMLLRRAASLPRASLWRVIADEDDDIEALVRLHRIALEGGDVTLDPAWPAFEGMKTTTAHYFRGVE